MERDYLWDLLKSFAPIGWLGTSLLGTKDRLKIPEAVHLGITD